MTGIKERVSDVLMLLKEEEKGVAWSEHTHRK